MAIVYATDVSSFHRPAGQRESTPAGRILLLLLLVGLVTFPVTGDAMPADSFSVNLNLKIIKAIDFRAWGKPTSLSKYVLADTTVALLSIESQQYKTVVEMDSAAQYVKIRTLLFDKDWLQPIVFTRESYQNYRLKHDLIELFREESLKNLKPDAAAGSSEALTIEIPFKIKSKTFNKIFGGDRVRLRISGNINIEGGFRREDRSQVATVQGQDTDYSFHIDQTQRFRIKGEIGDKVSVEVDQDSEAMFEFENALKLTYTGYEDEIIQKIEAGNISLQLAGTQLATFSGQNKGLFGLKAEMKFGAFTLTTIASLEKGEKNQLTVTGGAQEREIEVPINEPSVGQYFFLGELYRDQYKHYFTTMEHIGVDNNIRIDPDYFYVYKKTTIGTGTIDPNMIFAYAAYDSSMDIYNPSYFYEKSTLDSLDAAGAISDKELQIANFVPIENYYVDFDLGYIRLNTRLQDTDVLAVVYATNDGTIYGNLEQSKTDTSILKLIRPENPNQADETWPLAWRNVYSMQGANIEREGFEMRIVYSPSGTTELETYEQDGDQKTFLTWFGLDTKNENGDDQPDGRIDDNSALINYSYGEIIFPDLRPFDPEGYFVGNDQPGWANPADYPDSLKYPLIYDSTVYVNTNFSIKARFKSVQSVYELGFNVLEGSEEIYLGGRLLKRGSDYVIDYYSGTLTILNQAALSPSANLQINYESGELFQLDKKTLLGIRGEYHLWDQSFIGATALYLNEKPLQDRVRIGNEPLRNFLWDVNTRLVFKPKFLTQAVDYIPLVETDTPSELKVEMEYAQVHPNPNSLNNDGTGDPNGVAYVDDFESIKKSSPLGIMRRQWKQASYPGDTPDGKARGLLVWFNPYDQVAIKDIWPNRPTNANVAQRTHVLRMFYSPREAGSDYVSTKEDSLAQSWAGIQRALTAGYHDQENSEYIEIMLRVKKRKSNVFNVPGKLHLDLGQVSEDVIENNELDTEDKPLSEGVPYGNGFLDDGEDVGIDGRPGNDPNDWWDLNKDGIRDDDEPPSMDDFAYNNADPYDVWNINGTENNKDDEGGRYPDTEDLDADNFLDTQENFYRYTIDLSEIYPGGNYGINPGGQWHPTPQHLVTEPNEDGWKMYRIPLDAGVPFGSPDLKKVQYVRLWVDGFSEPDTIEISIATLEIVGNEWESAPVINPLTGLAYEPISVETINTYDDPNYKSPPGVAGERDPVTDIVSQEQSLVLKVNELADSTSGIAVRSLYQSMDFLEYRKLKMFVHGGGTNIDSNIVAFNDDDQPIWMFYRFGSDTTRNYYEYRQRVYANWDTRNEIEIDLDYLPQLKRPDIADTIMVSNGDTLSVVGNPSLSNIKQFTLGVITYGRSLDEDDNIEIWVDELRVSDVKKDIGRKARASADLKLADLATLNVNMEISDGDFHDVNTRSGTRKNSISGSATGTFQLQKFLNPKWGLAIPISGNFSQSEEVPYYFPNSDILVDDSNPEQVDSLKTYSQSYGAGFNLSKNVPSASPILKYTVDNLSGGYDYSHRESSNPTTSLSETETHNADVAYNLNLGRPSLGFLSFLKGVPVLRKYSEARLYWLITKINMSLSGSESITASRYRSGNFQSTHIFNLTKTFSTGLRPFESMTFDYSRTHEADLLMDPENPKGLEDILTGDLAWDEDNAVRQTVTASYNPALVSWLDSDVRYNTTYSWQWGNGYIPSGQQISNNSTITTSGTLKLTQIFTKPTRRMAEEGGETGQPGEPEQQMEPESQEPGGDKGTGGDPEVGGEGEQQEPGELEGEPEDSLRVLPVIAKPKGQSAISDFWYALRYTISRLRDLRVDYTQQRNWSDPLADGQAGIGYQLGINHRDFSKIEESGLYTGYSTRTRSDDYKFKSGLDFTRNFKISLSYNYGWSRNESNSVNGSYSQSRLFFFNTGGDSIDVTELPIPDWTVTLSGLEAIPLFQNIAETVTLENSYTGSKSSSWQTNKENIKQHDYTRNFSPLVGLSFNFKRGITASVRYNWTETGSVVKIPTPSMSRNTQKSGTLSASYTMKTGFKIPIPVWPFKNRRFKNSTTISLAFNYSNSLTENEADGKFVETNFTNTWSIKPSLDYTFSNTVTGGMHFEYGANKSKAQDSNYQEFGIRVNITIRG